MPPKADRKDELVRGTLDMMILRVLELGPQHGYGITRRIRQRSDGVLSIEEGSLYPALHRLEKKGWLASAWKPSENGRRAKYYRLTPRGRTALRQKTESWQRVAGAVARVMDASPAEGTA